MECGGVSSYVDEVEGLDPLGKRLSRAWEGFVLIFEIVNLSLPELWQGCTHGDLPTAERGSSW